MNKIRLAAGNSLELVFTKLQLLINSNILKVNIEDYISHYPEFVSNFVFSVESNSEEKRIQEYEQLRSYSKIEKQNNSQWLEPAFSFPVVFEFIKKREFFCQNKKIGDTTPVKQISNKLRNH